MKIKIKKILILQILLIPILFLSCNKDKNAENSENIIENHTSEEKIKIPKEDPAFFNMIEVKGGWCTIGYSYNDFFNKFNKDNYDYLDYRQHETYVSDFYICSSEITQELYEEIMEANPSIYVGKYRPIFINNIIDAFIFCNKLSLRDNFSPCYTWKGESNTDLWKTEWTTSEELYNIILNIECNFNSDGYRLPTESEWIYAAQSAGKNKDIDYQDSENFNDIAIAYIENDDGTYIQYDSPQNVKSKLPNQLGLYDMFGNADEIVWDLNTAYPSIPTVNYRGPNHQNERYITRGITKGGAFNTNQNYCSINYRNNLYFINKEEFGFRVCRSKISNPEVNDSKTQKAFQKSQSDLSEAINNSIYSKLIEIPAYSCTEYDKEQQFQGLLFTKEPINFDDILLFSEDYLNNNYSLHYSYFDFKEYNFIKYLNDLSKFFGLMPVYSFCYLNENSEYIEYTEEELQQKHLNYYPEKNDYNDETIKIFDSLYIKTDFKANGFRLPTYDEIKKIQRLIDSNGSKIKFKNNLQNLKQTSIYDLPQNLHFEYIDNIYSKTSKYNVENVYICRNLPTNENELIEIRNKIKKYTENNNKNKLKSYEDILGSSLNSFMKEIKGGKALLSIDNNNSENSFKEVKLGSFLMCEIPFTYKMYSALDTTFDFQKLNFSSEPIKCTWYEAAYLCNQLSDLYGFEKVYNFNNIIPQIDYTKNGFRMPTEAEWEHAARSGTTDKSIKYGVNYNKLIYFGNNELFYLYDDEWETYYRSKTEINLLNLTPNDLGIRAMTDYCQEWCNDMQYFRYDDFNTESSPAYLISSYDANPYFIKNMPYGQKYAIERIVKGHEIYETNLNEMKISNRITRNLDNSYALRLVRTKNPEEMKELLEEHDKEYLNYLKENKPYFDENLKMISINWGAYAQRDNNGKMNTNNYIPISSYEISDSEITNEMFIRIMHYNPNINASDSDFYNDNSKEYYNDDPNAPVSFITEKEAIIFCNELSKMYNYIPFYDLENNQFILNSNGFRLPYDKEWTYAAMEANPNYSWKYSCADNPKEAGIFYFTKPKTVKSMQPNKINIYDMSGNVSELVHVLYYGEYSIDEVCNMGGSFDIETETIYEKKYSKLPNQKVGFRIVRNIP